MKSRRTQQLDLSETLEEEDSFAVDALPHSDTTLRLTRRKHRPIRQKVPSTDNPYVRQAKSYASRKEPRQLLSEPPSLKKTKLAEPFEECKQIAKNEHAFALLEKVGSYFQASFFSSRSAVSVPEERQSCLQVKYPLVLPLEPAEHLDLNTENLKEIEIIANNNSKQPAYLHQALLQANNPTKLQDRHFFEGVTNPFDLERRNFFMKQINFNINYRSGYAPIELQENNETDTSKVGSKHFIKKKQSTLSLPRTCGVSYVKASESEQGQPFAPLPSLIFQCSSGCDAEGQNQDESFPAIESLWKEVLDNSWLMCVETDEDNMRELLIGKTVGKLFWVKGIQNLWPLFTEGVFIAVAIVEQFLFEQHQSWEVFHQSQLKIGILVKKSTSGKKSFFRSIGFNISKEDDQTSKCTESVVDTGLPNEEMNAEDVHGVIKTAIDKYGDECATYLKELSGGRTVTTLSLRFELYVKQEAWPTYSKETKNLLNRLILSTKTRLEAESLEIIQKRYKLFKSQDKNSVLAEEVKNIRLIDPTRIGSKASAAHYDLARQSLQDVAAAILKRREENEGKLMLATKQLSLEECMSMRSELWSEKGQSLKMPLYYISTRDSFAFDLITKETFVKSGERCYTKTEYFFDPDNLPTNYGEFRKLFPNLEVGVICYNGFFTNEELKEIEADTFQTEKKAFLNSFLQMTVQPTIVGSKIKRTKFFFGYRYMWTRCQLAEPNSYIGAGVRKDVTPPPDWIKKVEDPLVECGIVAKDFINSIAINVYHDGKEGLAQHFDDAVRFKQPIYTVRLFSDARLSFGSQLYGFCNGAFVIPLPRGCICVMKENSYAANGVKHCVRPCDMTGKSAAIILRQMHSLVTNEVDKYDEAIDFPLWMSTLSANADATSYAEQKRREAEYLLSAGSRSKQQQQQPA